MEFCLSYCKNLTTASLTLDLQTKRRGGIKCIAKGRWSEKINPLSMVWKSSILSLMHVLTKKWSMNDTAFLASQQYVYATSPLVSHKNRSTDCMNLLNASQRDSPFANDKLKSPPKITEKSLNAFHLIA